MFKHTDLHWETEFLIAVLVKIQVFWDVPCKLVQQSKGLLGLLDREHEDITLSGKVGSYLPVDRPYQSTGLNKKDGFSLQIYYYRERSLLCGFVNKKLSGSKQTPSSRFRALKKNCQLGQTMYDLCTDIEPVQLQDGNSSSCFPFNENVANNFLQCNGMPTEPPLTV